jgi:hypothetical protein
MREATAIPRQRRRALARRWVLLPAALLFGYLLLLGVAGYQLVAALQPLRADPSRLLTQPEAAAAAHVQLQRVRQLLGPLPGLATAAAALPWIGPSAAALEPALTIADEGLQLLQLAAAVNDLLPCPALPAAELLNRPSCLLLPTAAQPLLREALNHANALDAALARLPALEDLPAPPADELAGVVPLLRLAAPLTESAYFAALAAPYLTPLTLLTTAEPAAVLPAVSAALVTAGPPPAELLPAAQRVRQRWDRLPADGLPPELAERLPTLRAVAALAPLIAAALPPAVALSPLLVDDGSAAAPGERLVRALLPQQPALQLLQTELIDAHIAWRGIPAATRPDLQPQLLERLEQAARAVQVLQLLPTMLGAETAQTTLLFALSNDEQRPGGGFLTGAGRLVLSAGRYQLPRMEDSLAIVPPASRSSPPAPAEMAESMRIYRWFFRDANWAPDFRESARVARLLYAQSGRGTADQLIALDLIALRELVELYGPLSLPDGGGSVDADRLHDWLRRAHDRNSDDNGPAVTAVLQALLTEIETRTALLPQLALTLADLADRRHLLLISDDAQVAAALHSLGWDGAFTPVSGDYLALIEANVGYTKTSAALQSALEYTVDLRAPWNPQAVVTLTQQLALAPQADCPVLQDPDYAALMSACHRGLVQLLVPAAATLTAAALPPAPVGWLWDQPLPNGGQLRAQHSDGLLSLAHYYTLLPGGERRAVLSYSLPATVVETMPDGTLRYRLRLQKQVSQPALPLTLRLLVPAGLQAREPAAVTQTLLLDGSRDVLIDLVPVSALPDDSLTAASALP